jgi:uridine phosphorylase
MESSVILTLGKLMEIEACVISMTTVLENLDKVLVGKAREQSEEDLCIVALEGIINYNNRSENK